MNNETLADIIREMRARAARREISPEVYGLADRLEAAAQREKVEAVTIAATKAVNLTDEKWLRDTGNAAALRRALEDTEELLEHFAKPGTMLHSAFFLHMRDNRAALAAPPRNCDRFKAADEARMAFWDTHETIWDAFKNRGGTELFYEVLDWLFAPAEGKEASNG